MLSAKASNDFRLVLRARHTLGAIPCAGGRSSLSVLQLCHADLRIAQQSLFIIEKKRILFIFDQNQLHWVITNEKNSTLRDRAYCSCMH